METLLPKRNNGKTHKEVREQGHELLRRNVIDAASRLLAQEGPDALTVRRMAQELECSTKIIYTMFHGKEGLADALYLEGCERLRQQTEAIQWPSPPVEYIQAVARVYWVFALANPSFYRVMFCGAISNFRPSQTSILSMEAAFGGVVVNVQQYMKQGLFNVDDPVVVTKACWAPLHGAISLYLLGHFPSLEDAEEVYARVVRSLVVSLIPDALPDHL